MTEIREFQFDVMIRLPKGCPDIEDVVDRLYEAGSDDAVVGLGTPGLLGLTFIRGGDGPGSGDRRGRAGCVSGVDGGGPGGREAAAYRFLMPGTRPADP